MSKTIQDQKSINQVCEDQRIVWNGDSDWLLSLKVLDCTLCYAYIIFAEEEDSDLGGDEDLSGVENLSRVDYLKQLKQNDPEFYATMMQSSEVLDMHSSDSEEEGEGDEEENDEEQEDTEKEGGTLKPSDKKEVTVI